MPNRVPTAIPTALLGVASFVLPLALNPAAVIADDELSSFANTHCVKCHGPDQAKGDFRIDQLASPSSGDAAFEKWQLVAQVIGSGDMPPAKQPRPDAADVKRLLGWLRAEMATVEPIRGLRRMNRSEYEHTVHDLLGIDTPLADLLPEDTMVQGFDNVATGLGISSVLMERYLEAADVAFEGVFRRIRPLAPATRRAVLMDLDENIQSVAKNKGGVITRAGAFVDFTPGWPPARIDPAHPIEDGVYRCRVAVFPHDAGEHRTIAASVFVGPLFGDGTRRWMGAFDATGSPDHPRVIEFTTRIREGHTMHILPWIYPEHVTWRDKEEARPGLGILWAETYGPLDQEFPSAAQANLFGDSDSLSYVEADSVYIRHRRGVKTHRLESSSPRADLDAMIRRLLPRAFRRPVTDEMVRPYVELAHRRLEAGNSFEQAARAGVAGVLCSPHFLLLNHEDSVDDHAIASRLSYFLWSSMPDDQLLRLADEGKLGDPKVRWQQVERMLDDPKFERFIDHFTAQWLDLREIDFTTPDKNLYPEYDELLLRSMVAETKGFFRHVVQRDLPVTTLIDSDFAILNQRLAAHYGIEGVRGHEEFRVVPLPDDSVRGGVLSQASVLKVTANGTTTSPVLRGVWVLDKILGQTSPPPPPGVPAVEPDIRGASTIREQLAKHRENESCARCHARIDPPGFALEEFDAIGGHRDWYRSLGEKGERVAKVRYRVGPDVEKGDVWHDGRQFADFREFRRQILERPELVIESMAKNLLIYGTGRPVTPVDQKSVDQVVSAASADEFGLRSMIHAVVESDLFYSP